MKSFWLFRSNIKNLEYYHQYTDLEEFEKNCHDYYMLLPIWLLRNNYIDEAVVWRLSKGPKANIDFNVDGKLYSQRWIRNFKEVNNYPAPTYSLFRGGFPEYDNLVKTVSGLGTRLYLGTGKRIYPQYGGEYDAYLQEDKMDFDPRRNAIPFYKTASPHIFYPIFDSEIKYDICWPANFTQHRYKGQKFFIKLIASSPELQQLKIVHLGNNPNRMGNQMCIAHGVSNIEFKGLQDRPTLNKYLNQSKFGLVLSNRQDGCPRIATEILMSGTPMIIRRTTRLLPYYRKRGIVDVNDKNIIRNIHTAFQARDFLRIDLLHAIQSELSFETVCKKNIELWEKVGA